MLEVRTLLTVTPYLPAQYNLFVSGGYLTAPSNATPVAIADSYLRSHASQMGLVAADFDHYAITTNYITKETGATTLTFEQTFHDDRIERRVEP